MNSSVESADAIERVESPERLDEYIRVATPSAWLMVAMLFVLVASVCVWGVTGTLPETLTVNGVLLEDGGAVCYVEVAKLNHDIAGRPVRVSTADGSVIEGQVKSVSATPLSRPEIVDAQPNAWMADMLSVDTYAYEVTLELDRATYMENAIVTVTLITAEVKPISFLF